MQHTVPNILQFVGGLEECRTAGRHLRINEAMRDQILVPQTIKHGYKQHTDMTRTQDRAV